MIKACAGCGLMDVQGRASVGVWTATGGKIGFIGRDNLERATCLFCHHHLPWSDAFMLGRVQE